ncbi:MAG: hypothetical protein ACOY3Z_10390 [Thermodesulfobacteriota bacterium]
MTPSRKGEKIGWVGGWLGGFLWIFLLGIVWLVQGRTALGLSGLALSGLAVLVVLATAPWRHPAVPYWRLMLPLYAILFGCVAWAIWAWGGMGEVGLGWWSLWWLLPLLTPFGSVGRRCWRDGEPGQEPQTDRQQHPPEASP